MTDRKFQVGLLCLLTLGLGVLFAQEPGLGDDLTYWTFAYDLHEVGLPAWGAQSFHDLRWPVWGVCWILQGLGLVGISAYTGVAVFYLMAGAACAFAFGRLISKSFSLAWAAALAFVMCPLIDTVCHRPMPDLSEGVWGGATLLAWWALMHAPSSRASLGWAVLTGLGVYITESNRLTGVFIIPVLIAATLVFARKRFWWLAVAGLVAALFYAGEAVFYHHLFHDWLHNLNANLNGKGNRGTSQVVFLTSPFRFLYVFWRGGHLAPVYSLLALVGLGSPIARRWRPSQVAVPAESLIALWFIVLYLEYACAPQSLHPWQPVIRDAARFLGGLAIPFSILAVLGTRFLLARAARWLPHPVVVGSLAMLALLSLTARPFLNLGLLKDLRAYVIHVPNGTKIFTHHMMRALAIMADPSAAQRLQWSAEWDIMDQQSKLEEAAARADEFWYIRKIVWTMDRKQTQKKIVSTQPPLASYFANPDERWALARLLVKGSVPDFAFYRRRAAGMPTPVAPDFGGLLPTLPVAWSATEARSIRFEWPIPPALQGKCLAFDLLASADEVEPGFVAFRFEPRSKTGRDLLWKPTIYPEAGHDFFLLPIPAKAERCTVHLRFSKSVSQATLAGFSARLITPLDGISWPSSRLESDQ